jgi:hypothetical protein
MTLEQLLKQAYLYGFNASSEGWNAEYGTGEDARDNATWCAARDEDIQRLLRDNDLLPYKDLS